MPKRAEIHTHTESQRPQAQANRYTGRLSCHSLVAHKSKEWWRERGGKRENLGTGRFSALTRRRDTHFLPCPALPCCLCELGTATGSILGSVWTCFAANIPPTLPKPLLSASLSLFFLMLFRKFLHDFIFASILISRALNLFLPQIAPFFNRQQQQQQLDCCYLLMLLLPLLLPACSWPYFSAHFVFFDNLLQLPNRRRRFVFALFQFRLFGVAFKTLK